MNANPFTDLRHAAHLSSGEAVVFEQPARRALVIGFRGTDLFNLGAVGDIQADASIFFGHASSRFDWAVECFDLLRSRYPRHSVTLTGHSLGGAMALYVGRKRAVDAVAFNPGMGVPWHLGWMQNWRSNRLATLRNMLGQAR